MQPLQIFSNQFYLYVFIICFYCSHFRFGRKTAMLVASLLHVAGGCGSSFAPNYGSFVAFRFLVGMSNMGIFLSTFVVGKI